MDAELAINHPGTVAAPVSHVATSVSRFPHWLGQLLHAFVIVAVAVGSYVFASRYVVQSVRVSGASMEPTLRNGQVLLLNRWIYHVRSPRAGDVVVLRDPTDNSLAVKRIIGAPGDEVELSTGPVRKNHTVLNEPYLSPYTKTYPGPKFRHQVLACAAGKYVVMGDNRMNSADSREYGAVNRENILGVVIP